MNELLFIVPSRGRPSNVARLIDGWAYTSYGVANLLVVLDEDDPTKNDYREILQGVGFAWFEVGPPPTQPGMAEVLNRYAERYWDSFRALGFMGDDHLPRTGGWDERFAAELDRPGINMVYGNDLFQRGNLPTAVAMLSAVPRAMGYMVPGGLVHLYIDNAWLDIGRQVGISYLDHVVIEHIHPAASKAPMDEGYARVNSLESEAEDRTRYLAYQVHQLDEDVQKIREAVRAS